jgi:hypothetical protein
MITIFCDFCQFSAKKLPFFSKTNVMIQFLHNSALFWEKTPIFCKMFRRKYLKNHNIGPWMLSKWMKTVCGCLPCGIISACEAMGREIESRQSICRWPSLTSPLAPRGEICPLGGRFTPSFTPSGEHSLLFRRVEGRTENFTPKGQNSPLGDNFAHGVKVCP